MIESGQTRDQNSAYRNSHFTACDSLMRYAQRLGYGEIYTKIDAETGLQAFIVIHSLKRGPAIGGCRLLSYSSVGSAIEDALRLGHLMSYKAAINLLPNGGGKAVLLRPKQIKNRDAYFEKFGEFVNELGGRYITAIDSGTNPFDMDIIARRTSFVTSTTREGNDGDPSPFTAIGVSRAIEAAVHFKLQKKSLDGVHVAIQGAGHVGYHLAKDLKAKGARITMTDINPVALQKAVSDIGVEVCGVEEIFALKADVFSPCALGAVLNLHTIKKLKTPIIAGSANNQLAHLRYGALLHDRGILYAPDFLINAGGLIHVAVIYDQGDLKLSMEKISQIYDTAYDIFEKSKQENRPTNDIAVEIARERLK